MAHYNTVLHQLVSLLPGHQFDKFVEELGGDHYVKTFSTRSQLTTLLYAQAGGKQSLRDIENGLLAQGSRLYHLGLPSKVAKSTLSYAAGALAVRLPLQFLLIYWVYVAASLG